MIPYTSEPLVEHKYVLTLYSDFEHTFERVKPRAHCEVYSFTVSPLPSPPPHLHAHLNP